MVKLSFDFDMVDIIDRCSAAEFGEIVDDIICNRDLMDSIIDKCSDTILDKIPSDTISEYVIKHKLKNEIHTINNLLNEYYSDNEIKQFILDNIFNYISGKDLDSLLKIIPKKKLLEYLAENI